MSADDGRPSSPRAAAGAHDGRDSDLGGDDDGGDAGAPGRHVPWVDDAFEPGREAAARALLAARGADLPSALFWRGAHASHARRAWEAFYARHDDRFFRERHYLARDFPALASAAASAPTTLLELGAGTGAACRPLLRALPRLRAAACDLSPSAVAAMARGARAEGLDAARLTPFVHDAAAGGALDAASAAAAAAGAPRFPARGVDFVLLLFMLSAMPPEAHATILADAARALAPGGALLFRDYGELDEAQLRLSRAATLGEGRRLGVRPDGTLVYFFTPVELAAAAARAGLEVEWATVARGHGDGGNAAAAAAVAAVESGAPCAVYLCRAYANRAEGVTLRRVFVHAVFRKPADGAGGVARGGLRLA